MWSLLKVKFTSSQKERQKFFNNKEEQHVNMPAVCSSLLSAKPRSKSLWATLGIHKEAATWRWQKWDSNTVVRRCTFWFLTGLVDVVNVFQQRDSQTGKSVGASLAMLMRPPSILLPRLFVVLKHSFTSQEQKNQRDFKVQKHVF